MAKFKFQYLSDAVEIRGTATAENEQVVRTVLGSVVIKATKAKKASKSAAAAEEK